LLALTKSLREDLAVDLFFHLIQSLHLSFSEKREIGIVILVWNLYLFKSWRVLCRHLYDPGKIIDHSFQETIIAVIS
jgi:hypothetical protein